LSKSIRHSVQPSAPIVRKDAFTAYEDELRTLFPSSDDILREARRFSQARKKAKKRAISVAVLLLTVGTVAVDPVWQVDTMTTAIGKQARYELPDGSNVVLNTNSIVKLERHIRSRQLHLVQGEAAFNVSHDWRPFTVMASDVRVKDIGTHFNVRLKPEGVRVAVLEGAVEVSAGDQHQVLTTGQSIESRSGVFSHLNTINPDHEAAWQQGKLVFNGTPLSQVANEIQRYSVLAIHVDKSAASMRVSGVYDINAADALIKDLPLSLPVEITRKAQDQVLIQKASR
jgi:transmembrane sensor